MYLNNRRKAFRYFPAAAAGYTANAAKFTTTTDYLTRSSFVGAADSKLGILSCWVKFNAGAGSAIKIFMNPALDFLLSKLAANSIRIEIYNAGGTVLSVRMTSTATTLADGAWHHILIAWDSADVNKCKIAIDGTVGQTNNTTVDNTLDYTLSSWQVSINDTTGMDCDISEFYFAPGQWLDITQSSNVEKFRSAGAKPVSLGSDGSVPTSTAPIMYLKSVYTSFGTNSGTGGDFTVNGTLEDATAP